MNRLGIAALGTWGMLAAAAACGAFDSGANAPEAADSGTDGEAPDEAGTAPLPDGAPDDAGDGRLVGCDGPCTVAFGLDASQPRELRYSPERRLLFVTASPGGIYQWDEGAPDAAVPVSSDPAPSDLAIKNQSLYWISNGDLRHGSTQCEPDAHKYLLASDRIYLARSDGLWQATPVALQVCGGMVDGPYDPRGTFGFVSDTAASFRAVATFDAGATIIACDPDCNTGRQWVPGLGPIGALALDDERIYWTEGPTTAQLVGSAPRTNNGGPVPVSHVSTAAGRIRGLSGYLTTAYWTDEGLGALLASKDGAPARVLMSGLDTPWGVAVSDGWIYVAEAGKDRVIRLPR